MGARAPVGECLLLLRRGCRSSQGSRVSWCLLFRLCTPGPVLVGGQSWQGCAVTLPTRSPLHSFPPPSRGRIEAHRQVTLRPGDVVSLAEPDISFEVAVAAPLPPAAAVAASNGAAASAASVADAPTPECAAAADQQAAATLPAVVAALRLAGALEAAAAEQGLFPPGGAVYADLADRVRQLMAAGSHDQAYVLLLAGVMQQPWAAGALMAARLRWGGNAALVATSAAPPALLCGCMVGAITLPAADAIPLPMPFHSLRIQAPFRTSLPTNSAGLWAQLANTERQRARLGCRPGSFGAARAFYAAAADAFAAMTPATAGGALRCAAERAEGLSRVYSSWAQQELSLGHVSAARTLFRMGISAAQQHPAGAAAAGAPRQLVRWAGLEWKAGEAAAAQRLCVEALELEPSNAHALTLLGNIEVRMTERGACYLPLLLPVPLALLLLALSLLPLRLASALTPPAAHPAACSQAAARQWVPARRLFKRAVEVDPGHVAALQAWGRLEVAAGERLVFPFWPEIGGSVRIAWHCLIRHPTLLLPPTTLQSRACRLLLSLRRQGEAGAAPVPGCSAPPAQQHARASGAGGGGGAVSLRLGRGAAWANTAVRCSCCGAGVGMRCGCSS